MAIPAAVATAIATMKAATASGTDWATAVGDMLEAAVGLTHGFRDPAFRDVAPGPGRVVTIVAGGKIPPEVLAAGRTGIQKIEVEVERSGRGTLVSYPALAHRIEGDTVILTLTLHMVPAPGGGSEPQDPDDNEDAAD